MHNPGCQIRSHPLGRLMCLPTPASQFRTRQDLPNPTCHPGFRQDRSVHVCGAGRYGEDRQGRQMGQSAAALSSATLSCPHERQRPMRRANSRLAPLKYVCLRQRACASPSRTFTSCVDIVGKSAAQYRSLTGHPVEARCPGVPATMNGGPGALSNQCDRWPMPLPTVPCSCHRFSP